MWRFQWFFNVFIHCHCTLLMFIEPFFLIIANLQFISIVFCVWVYGEPQRPFVYSTHTYTVWIQKQNSKIIIQYIYIYIWSEWCIIHQRRFNYKSEEIHPLNGALNHFVRTNQHFILALSLQRQQSAITNRDAFATVGMLLPLLLVVVMMLLHDEYLTPTYRQVY